RPRARREPRAHHDVRPDEAGGHARERRVRPIQRDPGAARGSRRGGGREALRPHVARGVGDGAARAGELASPGGPLAHRGVGRRCGGSGAGPVGTFAGFLTAVLLAGFAFVGVAAAATFGYFASDLPSASDLATVPVPLTTHIYDRSGQHLLYTLSDERRDLISIDAVPKRMQDATIAIEDKTFWTNPGVDVGGIIRAIQVNSASGR